MNELVLIENGHAVTTSLKVAETFGKAHDKVLRDIRELACSEEFRLSNFGESSYINEQNKEQPMYCLTRDGFTLLAMGYTGKKAMQFKEAYIAAFNAMEKKLKEQQKPMTHAEIILQLAQMNVENERKVRELEAQQHALESKVEEIVVRTNTNLSYSTIVGFASRNGIKVTRERAAELGRACTGICKVHGYDMGRITDPRFGYVKTYPDIVLNEVFEGYYPNARIRVA